MNAVTEGKRILRETYEQYKPMAVIALFSGGTDSQCATHLAYDTIPVDFVFKVDTQTGIRQTNEFVAATCQKNGWPLIVKTPPKPATFGDGRKNPIVPSHPDARNAYEALVYHFGFPGPAFHTIMYNRLKQRCLEQLEREVREKHGDGKLDRRKRAKDAASSGEIKYREALRHIIASAPKIMLLTGVRKEESKRRMGYVTAVNEEKGFVWCAPCVDWNGGDKDRYMLAHGLEKSEVSKRLCMSGECLCGAFADDGEINEIAYWYPEKAAEIRELQDRVKAAGQPNCEWGKRPLKVVEPEDEFSDTPLFGMCWSCCAVMENANV